MNKFKANQKLLFKAEIIFNLRFLEKYEILFSFLGTSAIKNIVSYYQQTTYPHEAILWPRIDIKNVSYLSDLVRELKDNPNYSLILWFSSLPFTLYMRIFLPS